MPKPPKKALDGIIEAHRAVVAERPGPLPPGLTLEWPDMSAKIPPGLGPMEVEDEEYTDAVMDVKLELVGGFLIDGPDYPERRERLFLALLKNIGLVRAVDLVGRERWEDALA